MPSRRQCFGEIRADGQLRIAGTAFATGRTTDEPDDAGPHTGAERPAQLPPRDQIEAALRTANGAVVPAARALGVHRNQLRRWLTRNNVDPRSFSTGPIVDDPADA